MKRARPWPAPADLRPADHVMSLERAAAVVAHPLSFSRVVMRALVEGRWRIEKERFDLDAEGRGEILYRLASGDGRASYTFFLISLKLAESDKMDRNWAASWDAMGVLCEGEWTPEREARLRREIPKQRGGFADYDTLVYARGNRSGRLFEHVCASLAEGNQPSAAMIARVGYILRTTAFIANGQLGTRAHDGMGADHPLGGPFFLQMASAFALREYVFDLVDHIARSRNPERAVRLDVAYRRYLGLGNAAATGLVPFVVNHPHLMHRWTYAYESALAETCAQPVAPGDPVCTRFEALLAKAIQYYREGDQPESGDFAGAIEIVEGLMRVEALSLGFRATGMIAGRATGTPWRTIIDWAAEHLPLAAAEALASIVLELYPAIVRRYDDRLAVDETRAVDPAMTLATLGELLARHYAWALPPAAGPEADRYFWYRAAPAPRDLRRGLRGLAPELEAENAMETPHRVRSLAAAIGGRDAASSVATLLADRPDLRYVVARVQSLAGCDYAELQADWGTAKLSPFPPVRFVLAPYGMEKMEAVMPKQVRGAFMQGAPIAEDVERGEDGRADPAVAWPYPLMPRAGSESRAPSSPLPPAGLGAVPKALGAADRPDDTIRLAPAEVARMIATALQGAGASLGVAEDAARTATFAHAIGRPALAIVQSHCERGRGLADAVRGLTHRAARDDRVHVFDSGGHTALVAAPAALDCACATALAKGAGASFIRTAADVDLLAELALRAAERGLLALALWPSGYAVAGAGADGAGFASSPLTQPARLHADLAAGLEAARAADLPTPTIDSLRAALAPAAGASVDGSFALVCVRAEPAQTAHLVEGFARTGIVWTPAALRAERQAWQRLGLPMRRAEFDALNRVLAKLWVPAKEEPRLRPREGVDPLQIF